MAIDGRSARTPGEVDDIDEPRDPLQVLWRVATWEYDPATDHVYWLDSPADVLGVDEDTARMLVDPILVSMRQGAPWGHFDLERTVQDTSGAPIDVRVQARRLEPATSELGAGCVGVAIDVSEQRRTERELRGIVDRYRQLVDLSPDIIAVHQHGIIRYVNPTGVRMAKVADAGELIGRSILDFVDPVSVHETLERIAALTEPGMASEPSEAILIAVDGTRVPMESVSVRTEWEGEPAFQVILRDVSERRRAEAALRHQASLVEHVSDAIVATDLQGRITSWNPAAEAVYGSTAGDVLGRPLAEVLGADSVDDHGLPRAGEVDHATAGGRPVTALVSVARIRDELGAEAGVVAMCADLTERLEREAAEARFAAAVAVLDEGVVVIDDDGVVASVNQSAQAMLGPWLEPGVEVTEIVGRFKLVSEQGRPMSSPEHPLAVNLATGRPQERVIIGLVEDDWPRWVSMSVQAMSAPRTTSGRGSVVWSFSDHTQRKRAEEQLRFQATHDPLTRLPNRNLCQVSLGQALVASRRDRVPVAVLWLDLDRFKSLNDSLGHVVGDKVLKEVAARLRSAIGPRDVVARLAGDEFLAILPGMQGLDQARFRAEQICREVARPMWVGRGREIAVTASVGVTLAEGRDSAPEDVLAQADLAVYQAKRRGRGRVEVFDESLRSAFARRVDVEQSLRRALDETAVSLLYQPILRMDDRQVVGAEALARWTDPALGEVEPSEFIPVAEETGVMIPLGTQLLRDACREAAAWGEGAGGGGAPMVSVNVSPRQLTDPAFTGTVANLLEETTVDPDRLWLEVTESVLVEEAHATSEIMAGLRNLGVHLAIDDFGTGYSSLGYLRRLPVEAVKVDRSFVAGLGESTEADAIVEAILRLGQALGLRTIAEGVETETQLARLVDLGCDEVQGFLFSPPIHATELRF